MSRNRTAVIVPPSKVACNLPHNSAQPTLAHTFHSSWVQGSMVVRHGPVVDMAGRDYNVLEGGLLPFGMLILLLSPLIAWKLRGSIR